MADNSVPITDIYDRPLRDLRVSVTDRCNFRCTYCMPREVFGRGFQFMPARELLTFEEIGRLAGLFLQLGGEKIRLTGGEPLLRRQIERLVGLLAGMPGLRDMAMTTNGSLLEGKAAALREAGLSRISVSLDSLRDPTFAALNDVAAPVSRVLAGIERARLVGLAPIKINMVVKRGVNEQDIVPMAAHFRGTAMAVRFIEFMDVGNTNGWRMDDVVPSAQVLEQLDRAFPLEPLPPRYAGEVASRYRYRDGGGEIGVIASVTQPFCGACTRLRLTADGQLYTCLFASKGFDLRGPMRGGATDGELMSLLKSVWHRRGDRYSEQRGAATAGMRHPEMSRIGG